MTCWHVPSCNSGYLNWKRLVQFICCIIYSWINFWRSNSAALRKWHMSQHRTSYCVHHLPWKTAQMSIAISWWCSPVLTALWVGRHGTGARTPHWWNSPVHYSVISGQMDQCYYTNNTSSLDNIYWGIQIRLCKYTPSNLQYVKKTNLKITVSATTFESCNLCDNSYQMTSSEDFVYLHGLDL
jgi:hypothetical protein